MKVQLVKDRRNMTGLTDIMTVCNNIHISNCSHYINFSSFFLLSYTQTDDSWFIPKTSACNCGLYSCSDNLCYNDKLGGLFFKLNGVFFYTTLNWKYSCEFIQSSGTHLSTELWS